MKQKLIDFYSTQLDRVMAVIDDADPLSKEYGEALDNLTTIRYALSDLCRWGVAKAVTTFSTPTPVVKNGTVCIEPCGDVPTVTTASEVQTVAEEPERNDDDPAVEHPHYSMAEVRARLVAARLDHGVQLNLIFKQLGCSSFSEVPSERYCELLDVLDHAIEEPA